MGPLSARTWHARKGLFFSLPLILLLLLLSACNGSPETQAQTSQSKGNLDIALSHAQNVGVPADMLQPILKQEADLSGTHAPLSLFGDQPANDYYTNLTQRYNLLTVQVNGLIVQATQQLDYQATQDLQNLQNALVVRQGQNFAEAKTFASQLSNDQKLMARAQYPKDFLQISTSAKLSTEALHLMGPTYESLQSFQHVIGQLQSSKVDVTSLQLQAQSDLQLFRKATQPADFSQLDDQINTQLQETTTLSTQAIPYVGAAKLREFSSDIGLLKQYGISTATYQQHLTSDQQALANAKTIAEYLKISGQIDNDIASIQFPLLQGKASFLVNQFHQEVNNWGNSHQYHDSYDGNTYTLDYEYADAGIGSDLDAALQSAQTQDDYQSVVDLATNDMLHMKMMEADYSDKTAWNVPHSTDLQLLNNYGLNGPSGGQVLVVSLIEQVLRYYINGKLVQAYYVTTGQPDLPSLPGFWQIFVRESPTVFKSPEPKGSPHWYPDTPINFAMEYHSGGYFFHDSWWRSLYGPGTNFPHLDPGGSSFATQGSHGCINVQEQQAAWLYANTSYNTNVIIY